LTGAPLAVAVSRLGLVDPALPTLRVDDDAVARGRAAFETLRVYDGRPFRLAQHLVRLSRSAAMLELPPPDAAEIRALAKTALDAAVGSLVAGPRDLSLRLYWTPGPPGGAPSAIVTVSGVPDWIESARANGQRLATLVFPRRSVDWLLPGAKSTSYATNMAAESEARRRGADDAVLVDLDGTVLEGTVTNIWWREGETLFTPSLALGILAGETRAAVLELATGVGYAVEEGCYPVARLLGADEVFTSSSVREVMPAVAVDNTDYPIGPAAGRLQAALRELATG
jgi:4-amino-4-deoxychorismate lyase